LTGVADTLELSQAAKMEWMREGSRVALFPGRPRGLGTRLGQGSKISTYQ